MARIKYMLICSLMVLLAACEKDTEPMNFAPGVTTGNVTDIYRKGATLSGSIHFSSASTAQSYGILFSELQSMAEFTEHPVKDGSHDFSINMQNLTPNTTYYYCAYANSGFSLAKGDVKSFSTTESNAPVFAEVTLIQKKAQSCKVAATIIDEGGSDLILTGFCWTKMGNGEPTTDDNVYNVSIEGNMLTADIIGLQPETEYQIRAYGVNSSGIGYSKVCVFTTEKAEVAYLCQGPVFNERVKQLANNNAMTCHDMDSIIQRIEFKTGIDANLSGNYVEVSADDSPTPIYASFNNTNGLLSIYAVSDYIEIVDASHLFDGLKDLKSIDFGNFGVTRITTDMQLMFSNCLSLQFIDCSTWDTSNVTNMHGIFYKCEALTSLDVANWNTSNVTDMGFLFSGCSAITSLDVSNWNTSNVTDMGDLFSGCSAITSLDVANWNTSNVTDMGDLFSGCNAITSLDVSNWNTSNVTDMGFLFNLCYSLSSLEISTWDTSNVTYMQGMFRACYALTSLDISKWNTSSVTNMNSMFGWCHNLPFLNLSEWNTSKVVNVSDMFIQCVRMTALNLSNWDITKVTNMDKMFRDCFRLTKLNISKWSLNENVTCEEMFTNCTLDSESCEIMASQATQNFLLVLAEYVGMETSNFTWVIGE